MKAGILSRWALRFLTRPAARSASLERLPSDPDALAAVLKPADVLLVEGTERVSRVISYLTTSTWSHAALYLGEAAPPACVENARARHPDGDGRRLLLEALPQEGVVASPLDKYRNHAVRVCRARLLAPADASRVLAFAAEQIGKTYDVDNIVDLARYFLPPGLVPARLRLDALHFGAGKPTEVICSSLLAQAFASVGYPVRAAGARRRTSLGRRVARALGFPDRRTKPRRVPATLIVPRDFDLSPFFDVVKPPPPEIAPPPSESSFAR